MHANFSEWKEAIEMSVHTGFVFTAGEMFDALCATFLQDKTYKQIQTM